MRATLRVFLAALPLVSACERPVPLTPRQADSALVASLAARAATSDSAAAAADFLAHSRGLAGPGHEALHRRAVAALLDSADRLFAASTLDAAELAAVQLRRIVDPVPPELVARHFALLTRASTAEAGIRVARIAQRCNAPADLVRKLLAQFPSLGDESLARASCGEVWIGMSAEELTASLGPPEHVNRTVAAGGTREQWVYPRDRYAYVENGKVATWQDSR